MAVRQLFYRDILFREIFVIEIRGAIKLGVICSLIYQREICPCIYKVLVK